MELALKGLLLERQRIDEEIADIQRHLGIRAIDQPASGHLSRPKKGSAAYRKKISDGMKRRWAERRRAAAAKTRA